MVRVGCSGRSRARKPLPRAVVRTELARRMPAARAARLHAVWPTDRARVAEPWRSTISRSARATPCRQEELAATLDAVVIAGTIAVGRSRRARALLVEGLGRVRAGCARGVVRGVADGRSRPAAPRRLSDDGRARRVTWVTGGGPVELARRRCAGGSRWCRTPRRRSPGWLRRRTCPRWSSASAPPPPCRTAITSRSATGRPRGSRRRAVAAGGTRAEVDAARARGRDRDVGGLRRRFARRVRHRRRVRSAGALDRAR